MKLRVVALGHRMPAWVAAGWADYVRRLPRELPVELVELKPEPRDQGKALEQLLSAEATRITAACKGTRMIALDERGQPWTTRRLAEALSAWREDARDTAFVIGSADGLAEGLKRSASALVSLSALTLPHGLVRIVLAEQLYRASSMLSRHPYHRE